MINLTREEAQHILKLLDKFDMFNDFTDVREPLRAKLSEPKPEPVAYLWECLGRWSAMLANDGEHADLSPPLWLCDAIEAATTPPQRKEWVGLTENEKESLWDEATEGREHFCSQYGNFADSIEAKLKEKNHG